MGNNGHILSTGKNHLPHITADKNNSHSDKSPHGESGKPDKNLKENASQFFESKWDKSEANRLKDKLFTKLPENSAENSSRQKSKSHSAKATNPSPSTNENTNNETLIAKGKNFTKEVENATNRILDQTEKFPDRTKTHSKSADNETRQTFETFFAKAKNHKDFKQFHGETKEFWNDVRQMSELRVVEIFVKGNFEMRAISRYGELLEKMNRHGGNLETFLSSLPPGERDIFAARFQLEKTFGADKLFVGNGVAVNERGEISLRNLLSINGKNADLPLQTILNLLGGDVYALSNLARSDINSLLSLLPNSASAKDLSFLISALFTNGGQMILNSNTSALLGLSLAIYQNPNAFVLLDDLALNQFSLKMFNEFYPANQAAAEGSKLNEAAAGRANELLFSASLISGALATIEDYQKYIHSGGWNFENDSNTNFASLAAGATGAIMGATVGCVVPMSENSATETMSLAASIVVGLADGGLRSFGVNTIVSAVAEGVQSFFDASSAAPLNSFSTA